jgi:hypothetical protein
MNVPNGPETPKSPPRPEAEAEFLRESISPSISWPEASPLEENIGGLAALEGYEEE